MGDWLGFGVDMELMELGHLGEGLLVFAFSFVFVTGACFGTSITLGAGWTVLPCGCVRSLCAARLSVSRPSSGPTDYWIIAPLTT